MSNAINIGFLGLGVVASSVVNLLQEKSHNLSEKLGSKIVIKKILVRDIHKKRKCSVDKSLITNNPNDILSDPDIHIILELMGGIDIAEHYVKKAITNGKHIITANKALIATRGKSIFSLAKQNGVQVAFEAAVGGGMPIIKVLQEGLFANKILSITGILNGTSNYILSKMQDDNLSFNSALESAQKHGYAEADPSNDLEGIDAAQKLCILSSIAFNSWVDFKDLYVEGINGINQIDLLYAKKLGYTIKHVAIAKRNENNCHLFVFPALIQDDEFLAKINGTLNGVSIHSYPLGKSFYSAAGAGGNVTASSVLADLFDVISERTANLITDFYDSSNTHIENSIEDTKFSYYLRIPSPVNQLEMKNLAEQYGISLTFISDIQNLTYSDNTPIIIVTNCIPESTLNEFLIKLQNSGLTTDKITKFRILSEYSQEKISSIHQQLETTSDKDTIDAQLCEIE